MGSPIGLQGIDRIVIGCIGKSGKKKFNSIKLPFKKSEMGRFTRRHGKVSSSLPAAQVDRSFQNPRF